MSVVIDTFECMFEYGSMSSLSASLAEQPLGPGEHDLGADGAAHDGVAHDADVSGTGLDTVRRLQARIRQMQASRLDSRLIPTPEPIARLLPGGGLKQGAVYSVDPSPALVMALLAEPSAAGSWCAVVGVPEFGVAAATAFGVQPERLVLVPHPGDQWLAVTAAVADVMGVVVTRPPKRASDSGVARLAARLRQRGATLLVLGTWPQSEAMIGIADGQWSGIGRGHGRLTARQVTVTVSSRLAGRPRSARLWLPSRDARLAPVEGAAQRIHDTMHQATG